MQGQCCSCACLTSAYQSAGLPVKCAHGAALPLSMYLDGQPLIGALPGPLARFCRLIACHCRCKHGRRGGGGGGGFED